MNKEIEELLNNFQEILDNPTTTDECYDGRIIEIDRSYDLEQDEIKLLLSYIEKLENNRDKAIEEIDNLLVYNEFSDTTKGFGNVPEQLKFYLSDYDNLEDFRKSLKGDSDE